MTTYLLILWTFTRAYENPTRTEFAKFFSKEHCESVGQRWKEDESFDERRKFECVEEKK